MAVKGNLSKTLKKPTGGLYATGELSNVLESIQSILADIAEIKISLLGKSDVGHKHAAEDILSVDGGTLDPVPDCLTTTFKYKNAQTNL